MTSTSVTARSAAGRWRGRLPGRPTWRGLMAVVVGCSLAAVAAVAAVPPPARADQSVSITWLIINGQCPMCGPSAYGSNKYIDPAGYLQAGQQVQLQVTGTVLGQPAAGATVYLSARLTGGGAAFVGPAPLLSAPHPYNLNAQGQLTIIYTVKRPPPGPDPIGMDALTAADDAAGSGSVTTSYNYDPPASYVISPVPLAPAGSLAAGQLATAQVTALDAQGNPVAGALVAYWDDYERCGTVWPGRPPRPPVGSADNPEYGFTDAAGQLGFTFTASGNTGGTSVLSVAGAEPQTAPVTTSYQC